jgi:hypothetical protein
MTDFDDIKMQGTTVKKIRSKEISQNYFTFQNKIYQPEKGVSMGSPI